MTIHTVRRLCGGAALLAAALLASCESPTGGGAGAPARMDVVAGDLQTAAAGAELPNALVVRVLDDQGRPVPQQIVNFVVTTGGGRVFAGASSTNAQGEARERWTLGPVAGDTQRVEVRAVDATTGAAQVFATFRAVGVPDAPASITAIHGASFTGVPGFPLPDSLAVRVTDRHGNRVRGATVAWTVVRGGGSASPATAVTDSAGEARTQWLLGAGPDSTHVLQAAASVSVTTSFTATSGVPAGARMTVVSGDAQSGVAGTPLPAPLVVRLALADGRPVAGAPVAWSASAGVVTAADAVTNAAGEARAQWVLPTTRGTPTVTASTPGVMPVGFTATVGFGPPATMEILHGDVGSAFASSAVIVLVRVRDAAGNPLDDLPVDWAVATGSACEYLHHKLPLRCENPVRIITRQGGLAGAHWLLGPTPGEQRLTITAGGVQRVLTVNATATYLHIGSPAADTLYDDSLEIVVTAGARAPIRSVTARVLGRTLALAPNDYRQDPWRGYEGLLLLGPDVPFGDHELVVTLEVEGAPAMADTVTFRVDRKPVVRLLSPAPDVLVRGPLRIRAVCEDDDPAGCARLELQAPVTAAGTGEIDVTTTLSPGEHRVRVKARDSGGQTVEVVTRFGVPSASWIPVARVHGSWIHDTDGARVLFNGAERGAPRTPLGMLDLRTGDTTTIVPHASGEPRLTPRGALFLVDPPHTTPGVYEWTGDAARHLGRGDALKVQGRWAAWQGGESIVRHDLVEGTSTVVQPVAYGCCNLDFDVAPNGDVAWAYEYRAWRYRNGTVTPLTVSDDVEWVATDGVNVAYINGNELFLTGPAGNLLLTRPVSPYSPRVALRNGWTAFAGSRDGVGGLWVRSPSGEFLRTIASETFVLGPAGELVHGSAGRLYYSAPPYSSRVDLGSYEFSFAFTRVIWPGDTPYILAGPWVFRIDR